MTKERYNQIIDEVYETYLKGGDIKWLKQVDVSSTPLGSMVIPIPYSKNEFIHKCKTDQEFSEKWGLKIEERELSWEERVQWVMKNTDVEWENLYIVEEINKESSPTKLITLTYNEEKIEVCE
jgi:hypothetical protein